MTYDKNSNVIPEDPEENLQRLESICVHWENKVESLDAEIARNQERLQGINTELLQDEVSGNTDTKEHRQRLQIRKKYEFTNSMYKKERASIRGRLRWASRIQIPFLKFAIKEKNNKSMEA